MKDERRGYPRVYMPIPTEVDEGDSLMHPSVIDISRGGICIRGVKDIPAGKELSVRIGEESSLVKMKVCWWHGPDMGCGFLEFVDEHKFAKMIKRLM